MESITIQNIIIQLPSTLLHDGIMVHEVKNLIDRYRERGIIPHTGQKRFVISSTDKGHISLEVMKRDHRSI